MTSILGLPAELVVNIFSSIEEVSDVCSLRLSNKYLERSSTAHFGRRYFRKKGFLVTTPSLNVLKSIASHEEFRKQMRHVWFNPDLWTGTYPVEPGPHDDASDESDDSDNKESCSICVSTNRPPCLAYRAVRDDHNELLYTFKLERELTTALRTLLNLEAIGMRRSEDHKPYGFKTLMNAYGMDPRILGNVPNTSQKLSGSTKLFQAIIKSLATTNVGLKRLYTDAIEIDNIPDGQLSRTQLHLACNSIRYLEFNAWKASSSYTQVPQCLRIKHLLDVPEYGEGLTRLFNAAPDLLELGLQIFPDAVSTRSHAVRRNYGRYDGSYSYHTFAKITKDVRLEHLTRLKLENMITDPGTLQKFLEPSHACLTSLKIRDIRLLSHNDAGRPWQPVLESLRDHCTALSFLFLYHLKYSFGGVTFVAEPETIAPDHGHDGRQWNIVGEEHFTEYHNISLELKGREEAQEGLERIVEKHWYQRPIYSYAMDESVWHTDTSDDEW